MRFVAIVMLLVGCAHRQGSPQDRGKDAAEENLRGYAFSACLAAGGLKAEAVDVAQSFYLEMADEPWRYERAKACATEFAAGRHNALNRNLVIPDCLAFMGGEALARIQRMAEHDPLPVCKESSTAAGPGAASPPEVR